jgi:hypothetical protein
LVGAGAGDEDASGGDAVGLDPSLDADAAPLLEDLGIWRL